MDSAKADVLSAIETLSSMIDVSENSNTPVKQELARCYNNLGNLLQTSGNTQEAITQFVRSLELLNQLPDNRPPLPAKRHGFSPPFTEG